MAEGENMFKIAKQIKYKRNVDYYYTATPQLTLLMDPVCSPCSSKLRTKRINYNETWKMKS